MPDMKEGQIVITKQDEKIGVSGQNVNMADMAMMLGVFAGLVVTESVKRGMPIEEVKDAMLDIFLAATARLDEDAVDNIINGNAVL